MARRHLLHLLLGLGLWLATAHPVLAAPNFVALDVYIDSGATPLAAYQIEITAGPGAVIAGVEGGAAGPFHEPPYYDPAALRGGRIVLAAFNTGGDLPHGRVRVATLHMREEGPAPADYEPRLIVAAGADGRPIEAKVSIERPKGEKP